MSHSFAEFDHIILQEMLVHPALFTHAATQKIAIIGQNNAGIVAEALKHQHLSEIWQIVPEAAKSETHDPRLQFFVGNTARWLTKITPDSLDIIIVADEAESISPNLCQQYLSALHADGLLIHVGDSLFNVKHLKAQLDAMRKAGFQESQILHFPQPSFPSGSRTAIMGVKHGRLKRVREKDVFNKTFMTRYYNFDVHKASSVMPEFMREELAIPATS